MNRVILMGRLTRDPNVRHGANENIASVARYTLAVDRRFIKGAITKMARMLILSAVLLSEKVQNLPRTI